MRNANFYVGFCLPEVIRVNWRVYISGFAVSTIFGLSFLFTKNSIEYVNVYTFLALRFGVASSVMLLLWLFGAVKLTKKPYWKLWKVALFQPIAYFVFETNGLRFTTSSEAGMLIALIPIVITILSPALLKERIRWYQILFAFLSFFGVFLIVKGGGLEQGALLGKLLVLGAVFSAAFYNIFSRKLSSEFTPVEITFFMMLTGFVFFFFLSIVTGNFTIAFHPAVVIGALYLGILSSTVAFFLVNFMLSKVSPTVSSLFSNLTTVISVIAGSFIRHERIAAVQVFGMILILVSLILNSYLKSKEVEQSR